MFTFWYGVYWKSFQVSSGSFLFFFFSTFFPGWPPEKITKSYEGNRSAKISVVLIGKNTGKRKCLYFNFIPCNFRCSMSWLCLSGVKFCYYRFYRSKTKRQDAKNKCCILLLTVIYSTRIQHGRISALFCIMWTGCNSWWHAGDNITR